jgi:uncharacterized protein YjbJ (UPF0337 family)
VSNHHDDRIEGNIDEVKGRAKSAWGNVTGDDKTKAEGEVDQIKGKAKQGMADLKDKAEDLMDDVSGDRRREPRA